VHLEAFILSKGKAMRECRFNVPFPVFKNLQKDVYIAHKDTKKETPYCLKYYRHQELKPLLAPTKIIF